MDEPEPTFETDDTRVWYLRTAASTQGAVHEQRVEYRPGSPFPPTHLHPEQDEHFEVEYGEMLFVVDGEEHLLAAGDTIDIPRGTAHRARNHSGERPAFVRWETRPALRSGEFFAVAARLGTEAGLLKAALLAHEYRDVFRPAGPVGRLVPVVARLARLRGLQLPEPELPTAG